MVKKALCIGLNYPKRENKLFGCVNDCLDWEHLLKDTFKFDETRVLIDQNPDGSAVTAPTQIPTHYNIITQLGGWLCKDVEAGDVLVFVFAGHGCQVRNGQGRIDEALVPEDFNEGTGEKLVLDDELHALFSKLPSGSFLTVILDCCHGANMLDVPCSIDTSQHPFRPLTTVERPREVANRTFPAWEQAQIKHAQARPRFMPAVTVTGPRQRRIAEGLGAHVGKMTLDPGVTAFLFSASRTSEQHAMDANIKKHQCGVMSFCLMEALASLRHRCTYEMLLEKASEKLEDIRVKYMTSMDQHFQLSFCPNSGPGQVVVFDEAYATAAQYAVSQQFAATGRQDGFLSNEGPMPAAVREVSTDFVPAPSYQPPEQHSPQHSPQQQNVFGRLYLVVHAAYNLASIANGQCDPYVVTRIAGEQHRTCTLKGSVDPLWEKDNHFTFPVHERDGTLDLEVVNAHQNQLMGRTGVDLHALPPSHWHRRRVRLQDQYGRPAGEAEVEFDVRLEPMQRPGGQQERQQPPQQPAPQQQQQPPPQQSQRQQPPQLPLDNQPRQPGSSGRGHSSGPGPRASSPMHQMDTPHGPAFAPSAGAGGFGGGCGGTSPMGSYGRGGAEDFGGHYPDIFGAPNLLGQMPNLLSNMLGAAGAASAPGRSGMQAMPSVASMPPASPSYGALPFAAVPSAYTGFPSGFSHGSVGLPDGMYTAHQGFGSAMPAAVAYDAYAAVASPYEPVVNAYAAHQGQPSYELPVATVSHSSYEMPVSYAQYVAPSSYVSAGQPTSYSTSAGVLPCAPILRAPRPPATSAYTMTNGAYAPSAVHAGSAAVATPTVAYPSGAMQAHHMGSATIPQSSSNVSAVGYSPYPQGRRLY
mmetsp:Transcript_9780/g.25315  ORF Transcript_9780/g.25315 Transcript_9780/m.25315 type:complete len:863 (-) Transcript_9780:74-2662(-)